MYISALENVPARVYHLAELLGYLAELDLLSCAERRIAFGVGGYRRGKQGGIGRNVLLNRRQLSVALRDYRKHILPADLSSRKRHRDLTRLFGVVEILVVVQAEQTLCLKAYRVVGAVGKNVLSDGEQLPGVVLDGGGTVAAQVQAVHKQNLQPEFVRKVHHALACSVDGFPDVSGGDLLVKPVGVFPDLVLVVEHLHAEKLVGRHPEVVCNDRHKLEIRVQLAVFPLHDLFAGHAEIVGKVVLRYVFLFSAELYLFSDIDEHGVVCPFGKFIVSPVPSAG